MSNEQLPDPMVPKPGVRVRLMLELDDAMSQVDLDLYQAETNGDLAAQIVALRSRAQLWRRYGEMLQAAGTDSAGAILGALRDETTAQQLEDGAR